MKKGKKGAKKKSNIPVGVKLCSIYSYISFVFYILLAMGTFSDYNMVIWFLSAVMYFFIGRGLWKGSNWARIVAIGLSGLGVVILTYEFFKEGFVIYSLFGGLINLVVGIYLLFSKSAKDYFKKRK